MRYPLEKNVHVCWTLCETISVWSLKKCGVSKCLRLNGWNNIMVLKHPRSLSLWSICLSACVYLLACFQHSTYMFQPEMSREVTPRIRNLHSQIPNTEFQRSCSGEALASWWATPGNPRTIAVKAAPGGRGCWSGAPLIHTPKRSVVSGETSRRGFLFTKDCVSEGLFMARCQLDLSSVPTHAENYPPALGGVHARM